MDVVIVPADEAATLFERQPCPICAGRRHVPHLPNPRWQCHNCKGEDTVPARSFVVHTANIEGTIPTVVTLAVTHEFGRYPGLAADILGHRPIGTATVAHCWPIVASIPDLPTYPAGEVVELSSSGTLWLGTAREGQWSLSEVMADITGQVVGTPTPGAFLLELADATPV